MVWFSDTLSKRRERREHACERERWPSSEHETRICDCGCGGKELDFHDFHDFHVISARFTQFFGYSKTHTHTNSQAPFRSAMSSQELVNLDEFEALAKTKLPKMAFDYFASGSEDEHSLRENRNAFSRIR